MALVGVIPASAVHNRARLLDALGTLVGVAFTPINAMEVATRGLDGLIIFAGSDNDSGRYPVTPVPTLVLRGREGSSPAGVISFTTNPSLDPRLRGWEVAGDPSPGAGAISDSDVFATAAGSPVWGRCPETEAREIVLAAAPELGQAEYLRDRVTPGKCLAVIAAIHFLRRVSATGWRPPPLCAAFIVDDPNVRRPTYGHVDFREIADHAARQNHHVSFATIPYDLRRFDSPTVELFRSARARVSLTMHGNNHTHHELMAAATVADADKLLAQALRRVSTFELRAQLPVSRVMVPPHEALGRAVLQELPRLGFEAVVSESLLLDDLVKRRALLTQDQRVSGCRPAEITDFGIPIFLRRRFSSHEEATLRAFLDQPIIFYGHASDFAEGLEFLDGVARSVNRVSGVVWSDLSTLARSRYFTHRRGDELHVRPLARRLSVRLTAGLRSVVVHPMAHGRNHESTVDSSGVPEGSSGGILAVADDARTRIMLGPRERLGELEVALVSGSRIGPHEVTENPRARQAALRRLATETRDRAQPALAVVGRRLRRTVPRLPAP